MNTERRRALLTRVTFGLRLDPHEQAPVSWVEPADPRLCVSFHTQDNRCLSLPLALFPKLAEADLVQRENWWLTGYGEGMEWRDAHGDIHLPPRVIFSISLDEVMSLHEQIQRGTSPCR